MKPTFPPQLEAVVPSAASDFDNDLDYKEVYWPDFAPLPGETPIAFRLRFAFAQVGYSRTRIEEVIAPPVIIVRTTRTHPGGINDARLFLRHILQLLRDAGFPLKRSELTVDQVGDRVLVAFPSGRSAPKFEEILREPQDDLEDHADIPF